jgi:EpsI family protein
VNPGRRRALGFAAAMGSVAALTAVVRPPRPDPDAPPPITLHTLFPERFGDWRVDELSRAFVRAPTRDGRAYGLYDQLLERTFLRPDGLRIMLSVAYGREQSAGLQMHRPEICYRSGGYTISDMQPASLALTGRTVDATRLMARLPGRPEPITYWTLMGGAVVADAAGIRRRRLAAVLHHQILDGLLVRVSSIDDDTARAHDQQARFADEIVAAIAPADRAKVIGNHTEG